jgi:hypothetical protein
MATGSLSGCCEGLSGTQAAPDQARLLRLTRARATATATELATPRVMAQCST